MGVPGMIVRDSSGGLWFDWAIRFPENGVDARTLAQGGKRISLQDNEMRYVTGHSMAGGLWAISDIIRSMIGRWPTLGVTDRALVMSALNRHPWEWRNPSRPTTAWHASVLSRTDNGLIQHAPLNWRLAHGNSANPYSPGIELEGLLATHGPADPWQVATLLRMERDLAQHYGRPFRRANGGWHQHGEHGPTSCPEGRYAPLYAAWAKEEEQEDDEMGMTAEELARLERLERHLFGAQPGERMARLETDQRLDLEGRVSRLEDNNGPIGRRLYALEEHVDKHPTEGLTIEDVERLAVDAVADKLTGVDR